MRMLPARIMAFDPILVKGKVASQIATFVAPLKGLNLSTAKVAGDPQTAPILSNFVVAEDSIDVRPGIAPYYTHPDGKPVETLIPFAGAAPKMLVATNGKLATTAVTFSGFTGNDWSWTSFANLSQVDFMVMVNGHDGVWSWDGGAVPSVTPGVVSLSKLTKTNPATCTVTTPADIAKFKNGDYVTISGATGTGMVNANGIHIITSVNVPVNTFTLAGVDCSTGTADQTTGLTVQPAMTGSMVKETVTCSGASWFDANSLNIVMSHMNRLWFADTSNLCVYYLPIQQKNGDAKIFPLNAIFKRGGSIRAMYSWSLDGGAGLNSQMVIFTDQNECAIYRGTDPDTATAFELVGIYRFDSPMSKQSVTQYGAELYCMISTGLVPMTTLMRAEAEQLGITDKAVLSEFQKISTRNTGVPGWGVYMDYSSGRLICNMPLGAPNTYRQMVRKMPAAIWTSWAGIPSRSWCWLANTLYFGDDAGKVWVLDPLTFNDNGNPIRCDVQFAWSTLKTIAFKDIKMVRAFYLTDGTPQPYVDVKVDFDTSPPVNRPDISFTPPGADWDVADWDVADWAGGEIPVSTWNGCAAKGNYVAVRVSVDVLGCIFRLKGADIIYEVGSIMG